ncbi:unnamed protein product [Cylicostephanus goldi]|uniref:Uncharacterized protein n=1 Tax=Cylicostephanus goldi TaxID=71465 RepID=A0A3P7NEQ8_CYLGO|nr:unnamed protein product [Cylicostephanus goldi]
MPQGTCFLVFLSMGFNNAARKLVLYWKRTDHQMKLFLVIMLLLSPIVITIGATRKKHKPRVVISLKIPTRLPNRRGGSTGGFGGGGGGSW